MKWQSNISIVCKNMIKHFPYEEKEEYEVNDDTERTESEEIIRRINNNVFFEEFTFSKNNFITPQRLQLELADNVVWIDDYVFIYQIKERDESGTSSEETWFERTVLRKAIRQIKNSMKYLNKYSDINIPNERNHIFNLASLKNNYPHKIVIYKPGENLPDKIRFQKFYESSQVGLIHLFHSEDYYWICRYLYTPYEIDEYLKFRCELYKKHKSLMNKYPEQYVLGHFLETLDTDVIKERYIENVKTFEENINDYDISGIISLLRDDMLNNGNPEGYYNILKQLAKLERVELSEFKKRFLKILDNAINEKCSLPYRFVSINTGCGFVFITGEPSQMDHYDIGLRNFTEAHKYDQKLDKCIGVIVFHIPKENKYRIYFCYVEHPWEFNERMANILKNNFPFLKMTVDLKYRYHMKNKRD